MHIISKTTINIARVRIYSDERSRLKKNGTATSFEVRQKGPGRSLEHWCRWNWENLNLQISGVPFPARSTGWLSRTQWIRYESGSVAVSWCPLRATDDRFRHFRGLRIHSFSCFFTVSEKGSLGFLFNYPRNVEVRSNFSFLKEPLHLFCGCLPWLLTDASGTLS